MFFLYKARVKKIITISIEESCRLKEIEKQGRREGGRKGEKEEDHGPGQGASRSLAKRPRICL